MDARVLILEVAERHDAIIKLKNELNDMEEQLKQKDAHIQFKDEIIKELRRERRDIFKVFFFCCSNQMNDHHIVSIYFIFKN